MTERKPWEWVCVFYVILEVFGYIRWLRYDLDHLLALFGT